MSISTPLEQTYFKLHCNTCGCVTPHRDNSTTIQCEVCLYSNYAFSASPEYYTGWELAAFWQARYRAVVGYGMSYPVTAVAGPAYAVGSGQVFNVIKAEGFEGGMLVSPETIPFVDPNSIGTL